MARELKAGVEGVFNPFQSDERPISPGLRRRMQEFAEVEGLSPMHPEYRRAQRALDRQRNYAEGKPVLAKRKR